MPGTSPGMTKQLDVTQTRRPRFCRGLLYFETAERSARIEFDDQMRLHLHRERHVGESRDAHELRGHLGVIDLEEVGHVALAELDGFQHRRQLLGGFLDLDGVADLQLVAADVDAAAVHLDVAVVDELARGEHRGDELGAVDHGVEAALQEADQVFTGVALHPAGFDIDAVELALGNIGVVALQLLLGAQLHAEVGKLALAALAVLAGAVFAAVHRALRAAPDILAHTAIDLVFRLTALSHRVLDCWFEMRKRALLCAGNFPEPTGPPLKPREGPRVAKRNAGRNRPASRRVLGRNRRPVKRKSPVLTSMIRKSGSRFSEKIMLNHKVKPGFWPVPRG